MECAAAPAAAPGASGGARAPPCTHPRPRFLQSALALGVSINRDQSVRCAGGYLVQVLPFAEEETIAQVGGEQRAPACKIFL